MRIRPYVCLSLFLAVAQGAAQVPARRQQAGPPPLRPLAVTQLDERQQRNDLDSARPITLTASDPTPITELLLVLVRDTRLSVVPDPDVQGTYRPSSIPARPRRKRRVSGSWARNACCSKTRKMR